MAQGPVVHSALRVVPDALLLGAAWVLCVPPSRALGTVATAGKALNHGTDDHQPVLLSSRALAQSPWEVMAQGPVVHGALRVVPDAMLLGAAWALCVPPSRALVTVATAEKALNHGADDHQPILLSSRALAYFTKPVEGDGPGSRRPWRAARRARCDAARRCLGTMCPALARLGDRGDSRESAQPRRR